MADDKNVDKNNTDATDDKATDDKSTDDKSTDNKDKDKDDGDDKGSDDKDDKTEDKKEIEYKDFNFRKGVEVDKEAVSEFKAVAKEFNLNQEQAQKMVDLQSKFADTQIKATEAQFEKDKVTWKAEAVKALGSDSEKQMALGVKAMDKFGSPELKTLLSDSGLANRIEMIQLLVKVGKAVSEDKLVDGKGSEKTRTGAEIMYGSK